MSVKIAAVSTAVPQYYRDTADIIPFVETWLEGEDERKRRKAVKIFQNAGVSRRYSIMEPETVFSEMGFGERNEIYKREVVPLAEQVVQDALDQAGWQADSLDYIITVSCTGIMIPSIDAYLINSMGMKQDITRLPVTEMGCVAGVSAMIYAYHFLSSFPGKRAAIVAVEAPTATFQWQDRSMANLVSAAIFGDGAACALLSSENSIQGPTMRGHGMYHFYDAERMMGFDVVDSGLQMVLDKSVPDTIAEHFDDILLPFLKRYNVSIDDVDKLIFHPGGKKIVQMVEQLFGKKGKNIDSTKKVLDQYGNMSSATVLFVLKDIMQQQCKRDDLGLMLSFGPGFTAQRVLLEW